MADLLIRDLMGATGGRLQLAAMPPRDVDLTMLRRSTSDAAAVQPGDLYWALPGSNGDGMRHVEEAFARGACGAVISGRAIEPWPGKFTVRVPDVRAALWQTAALARLRFQGRVIGVAGNDAARISQRLYDVVGSARSGTRVVASENDNVSSSDEAALGLLNAHPSHEFLLLPLTTAKMAELCCPHVCVMAGGNASDVAVLGALPEDGWALLSGDDATFRQVTQSYEQATRVIRFGCRSENDLVALDLRYDAEGLRLAVENVTLHVLQATPADLPAILASIALGKILYISDLKVFAALGNVSPNKTDLRWQITTGHEAFAPVPAIGSQLST